VSIPLRDVANSTDASAVLDETSSLQNVVDDLCQFVRSEAPGRLAERIRAGLSQLTPAGASTGDRVDTIVESAVTHFADLVNARALRRGHPRTLDPSEGSGSPAPVLTTASTNETQNASSSEDLTRNRHTAEVSSLMHIDENAHHWRLPQMDSEVFRLIDFESGSKSEDLWNSPIPASWGVQGFDE
jgi:hypothetical protein